MKPPVKNFIQRTVSGIVLTLVVVSMALFSEYTFGLLLAVICAGCMFEFYRMVSLERISPSAGYGTVAGTAIVLLNFFAASALCGSFRLHSIILASIPAIILICFIIELYRRKSNPIQNVAVTVMGLVYIALPLSLFAYIPYCIDGEYSPWIVLSYFFLVWANDVGAYAVGVTMGKHRLFERISPKKSWEGFFGGLLSAALLSFLIALYGDGNFTFWIGLSIVTVLGGVLGDLTESMFKRSVYIKDSGETIPGHGGFLDRFDALIFSLPFVFIYFVIFAG